MLFSLSFSPDPDIYVLESSFVHNFFPSLKTDVANNIFFAARQFLNIFVILILLGWGSLLLGRCLTQDFPKTFPWPTLIFFENFVKPLLRFIWRIHTHSKKSTSSLDIYLLISESWPSSSCLSFSVSRENLSRFLFHLSPISFTPSPWENHILTRMMIIHDLLKGKVIKVI